jgi:thiamine pyrophosphate-dependent acetolactate synthase large subunit-like protein
LAPLPAIRPRCQAFEAVTIKSELLLSAETAAEQVDSALILCLSRCLPIFIELPSDIAAMQCVGAAERLARSPAAQWQTAQPHNPIASAAAVKRCAKLLLTAKRPALLAGVEVMRRDAQSSVRRLCRMLRLPVATTRHGKSALEEGGCICAGVYAGALSRDPVRTYIEGSDVLVLLGAPKTDMDFFFTSLDESRTAMIDIHGDHVSVHIPPTASECELGDDEASPAITRQPREVFGPVSLRGFTDALALEIFDHLGEVCAQISDRSASHPRPQPTPSFPSPPTSGDAALLGPRNGAY